MTDGTIDAQATFVPWYHHRVLILPPDARTPEARALKQFARQCRCDRIKANIQLSPSRSLFSSEEEAA